MILWGADRTAPADGAKNGKAKAFPLQCVKKVPNLDVIANQPAGWCGNPLQSSKNPPTINEKCLKIQGIPTPLRPQARAERNRPKGGS